jgi:type IV secretion system protein VirB2
MEKRMTSKPNLGRLVSDARARRLLGFTAALVIVAIAQPALAQSSGGTAIESGLNTIKGWMVTIASVVGVIAVMAVGYAKLTGRMDWGRAVTVLIGIGIIFSATTIVGWMSSSGG